MTFAFRSVLARAPTERERSVLRSLLEKQAEHFRKDAAAAKPFLAVGERPANAKLDPVELAAWGSVCLALFNLDEALTRE